MARRGNKANLTKSAHKAYDKVARRGGATCGVSTRGGRNRVCLSTDPLPGMKCGFNKINRLWGCAQRGHAGSVSKKRARARR